MHVIFKTLGFFINFCGSNFDVDNAQLSTSVCKGLMIVSRSDRVMSPKDGACIRVGT